MSFTEDCDRFGDQLARLIDAGIPVKEAAAAVRAAPAAVLRDLEGHRPADG